MLNANANDKKQLMRCSTTDWTQRADQQTQSRVGPTRFRSNLELAGNVLARLSRSSDALQRSISG
jgi:hypothetical protein